MRKAAQIRVLKARLKAARDRIGIHEKYLKEKELEMDFDDWFWSDPLPV